MFLIINPAEKNKTTLIIFKSKDSELFLISKSSFKKNYHQTEKLLPFIDKIFKIKKIKNQNLKGISVVIGPGPFTALRVGIIIANTMAYALKIPVAGIKLNEFKSTKELIELSYKKLKKAKLGKIALPFYDKEPNITFLAK